jgi:hypothetical protein
MIDLYEANLDFQRDILISNAVAHHVSVNDGSLFAS